MNQIQIQKENKTLDKARLITTSKRVRRTSNRTIWCVQSENPKTPNRFYRVMFDEDLDEFVCDCKAFTLGVTVPCKHVYSCALFEGSHS